MGRKRTVVPTEAASRGLVRPSIFVSEEMRTQICKKIVKHAVDFHPNPDQWQQLARTLTVYDHTKAQGQKLPTKKAVEERLTRIAATATNLAHEFHAIRTEKEDAEAALVAAANLIEERLKHRWRFELTPRGQRGHYEWDLSDLASLLDEIAESASTARLEEMGISPKDFGFTALCTHTAEWWEAVTGSRATARKDDDKKKTGSSPFIVFFADMLKAIPKDTRPSFNSTSALSKAFSESRAK